MEWSYSNFLFFYGPLLILSLILLLKKHKKSSLAAKKLPPGPQQWPIVGNIFDLGSIPHHSLHKLRFKYGPLIWLRLGCTNTLVVQSAKVAETLFKNFDSVFCDRKTQESFTAHNYIQYSISTGPYGPTWRFLRRFITTELMAIKKLNDSAQIRQKCITKMIKDIEEDSATARGKGGAGEVVVIHHVFVMLFNLIGNLIFSKDLLDLESKEGYEFFEAMGKVMEYGGVPNIADFFPFLKCLDPQGLKKKMEKALGRTLNIVEKFVEERIEENKLITKKEEKKDFLDALLEYEDDDNKEHQSFSIQNILITIVEIFFGGTETTSGTIEWVITELLRNPDSMRTVKQELREVIGQKRTVKESDIDNLPYFDAVIKETLRLHPSAPLLIPRNTIQDTNFMGYDIPKGTQVYVNIWSIGRDPVVWEDPLSFKPERFVGSDIDYKGQNFELLPFGAGRRICLGIPLAQRVLPFAAASLLHYFDWELDSNSAQDTLDVQEKMGIAVRKLKPIRAIPIKKIMHG